MRNINRMTWSPAVAKDLSIDKRLRMLETIVSRIQRSMPQRVSVGMPPIPIAIFCQTVPEDGIIAKMIVPMNCTLVRVVASIDRVVGGRACEFVVTVEKKDVIESKKFSAGSGFKVADLNMEIEMGTKITVSCNVGDVTAQGIYVTALLKYDEKGIDIKNIPLYDESILEVAIDEGV